MQNIRFIQIAYYFRLILIETVMVGKIIANLSSVICDENSFSGFRVFMSKSRQVDRRTGFTSDTGSPLICEGTLTLNYLRTRRVLNKKHVVLVKTLAQC